ncbi:MAG: porin [Gemmatimonadota bacterium]
MRHAIIPTPIRAATLAMLVAVGILGAQSPTTPVPVPGSYDGGYLVFQSGDGAFKYWLDGRLQVDAAKYSGGENELGGGAEVRRLRIGAKAQLFTNWYSEVDLDFAANAVEIKDAWIGYTGLQDMMFKAGNYKEPFSLETLTSSKNTTFMERSYADNFSPDRNIGFGIVRWGKQWQVAGGVFGQSAGEVDASARNEGYGITGRATFAPVMAPRRIVHFGVALSRRTPDAATGADTNTMRFRARPETDVSLARFLTTGKIRLVDHTSYYNAEAAMVFGRLALQGEYTKVTVRRLTNLADASFKGGYAFASLFLTDDTKEYLPHDGEFDRIHPKSSGGAWEVAVRYSTLDLNDKTTGVNILGGKGTNYTAGLNWYINTNFKWMFNYVRVINDENAKPDLGTAPFVTGDKFNIFQTRFALAF